MKNCLGRFTAGIGYGFLAGAAAGLTAGVITRDLFFWTVVGVAAGIVVGCIITAVVTCRKD
jgi:hypothetical protein